ncbi:MAG: NADH:flavin oxidoreductase [Chloroflexi bacterium]|nr:NADH:flavin oxidoreductase [Chloroflexota bacterium]
MPRLFSSFTIKGLALKNRLVMAPMATNLADEAGHPSAAQIEHYRERVAGGVGLVIVESVLVNRLPEVASGRLGLWDDDCVAPLTALARAIREAGAAPAVQIVDLTLRARQALPAALAATEIEAIVAQFAAAAARARAAGFAAVELHSAHATTLADFLSRAANRRPDEYGGSNEGRARFTVRALEAMRVAVGDDYPLLCRFNGDEFTLQGNTLLHAVPIAGLLLRAGADVLDVSQGGRTEDGAYAQQRGRPAAWLPDGCNLYVPREIKRATGAPVIGVGKLGNPEVAEAALADGACDLVALGRPLLADPDWPRKAQAGRYTAIKRCRCDDRCMELFREKKAVHCVTFAEA